MFLPEISLRSFSDDFLVLDKILHNNFYRLNQFKKDDVVIDLGAHVGIFTFLCFASSAYKIYSFEPFIENYRLLLKNIEFLRSAEKITTYQIGVALNTCNLNFAYPEVQNKFYNFSDILMDDLNIKKTYSCPCFSLNSILSSYVKQDRIELLKINIGLREDDILLSSGLLPLKVQNVCGQIYSIDSKIIEFQEKMKKIGYKDSYVSKIKDEQDKYVFFFSKDSLEDRFNLKD